LYWSFLPLHSAIKSSFCWGRWNIKMYFFRQWLSFVHIFNVSNLPFSISKVLARSLSFSPFNIEHNLLEWSFYNFQHFHWATYTRKNPIRVDKFPSCASHFEKVSVVKKEKRLTVRDAISNLKLVTIIWRFEFRKGSFHILLLFQENDFIRKIPLS
jgi:hypothetical protein